MIRCFLALLSFICLNNIMSITEEQNVGHACTLARAGAASRRSHMYPGSATKGDAFVGTYSSTFCSSDYYRKEVP